MQMSYAVAVRDPCHLTGIATSTVSRRLAGDTAGGRTLRSLVRGVRTWYAERGVGHPLVLEC